MMVTVFEVGSLPLLGAERSEYRMDVNGLRFRLKMKKVAIEFNAEGSLCQVQTGKLERGRILAELGVPEPVGRLSVVVEESFGPFKNSIRCTASEDEFAAGALKGPVQMLKHVLGSHVPPKRRRLRTKGRDGVR